VIPMDRAIRPKVQESFIIMPPDSTVIRPARLRYHAGLYTDRTNPSSPCVILPARIPRGWNVADEGGRGERAAWNDFVQWPGYASFREMNQRRERAHLRCEIRLWTG
jgi:hypothetical protein